MRELRSLAVFVAAVVTSARAGAQPPGSDASDPAADEPTQEDIVEVRGRPGSRHEVRETTISARDARVVAGSQGDVLKVLQNLPGVARPPLASTEIVVWGASPRETRIYIDGVDVPALYHGSALRSVISSDLVASVDVVPGSFGAEYGRGLGGVVRVVTRALPRGFHGNVAADTLDGSALAATDVGEHARIAVALRQSWLDRLLAVTSARDVGDFFPVPRYRDGQVKATIDLRRGEWVDLVMLGTEDELTRAVPSPDPAAGRRQSTHSGFWRIYARYQASEADGGALSITPFFGYDGSGSVQRSGAATTSLDLGSTRYGLRASLRSKVLTRVTVVGGLDALGSSTNVTRVGSLALPPREGDIAVFGQPPEDEVATDHYRANILDVGPHLEADVRVGPFTFTPGLRADAFLIEGSRKTPPVPLVPDRGFSRLETALAPRISSRYEVSRQLSFTAAYGRYHQAPEAEDLSAVFGTPDLGLARATHASAGESLRIIHGLTAEVVAYSKTMQDLAVRSRLSAPVAARSLTQNGEGRSYGLQLLLRQETWRGFSGWVSYAISRSERRYDAPGDRFRLFDYDQPHVLTIVANQELGRWSVGTRFRYASGDPRTPVVGSSYDSRNDRYDPIFGIQSSLRIPAFWQLDLRVERAFPLGDRVRARLFADVQNVTNRANAEDIVYSPSYRERGVLRGLPTIAVIGARVEL
ncbi:MAG: TonB family protein / TonB-dependent receptor [Labilithrix sp.]|nr:TonB family protein / TonB-dependent receptor [Labilithrix sp.]